MKNIFVVVLVLLVCSNLSSQTSYVKAVGSNTETLFPLASALTSDSTIVQVGYGDYSSFVTKFDRFGTVDWSYRCSSSAFYTTHTRNGKIYIGGMIDTSASLVAFDTTGLELFSGKITLPGSVNAWLTAIASDSSYLYLAGTANFLNQTSKPFLIKLDSNQNVVWCKQYPISGYMSDIIFNPVLNELLFLVTDGIIGNSVANAIVVDTSGNIRWSKSYPSLTFTKATVQHDSDYIILAYYYNKGVLLSIDKDGAMNWAKNYTDTTFSSSILNAIYISPDDHIYVGNRSSDPGYNPPITLMKLNSTGNVLWANNYWGNTVQLNGITAIFPNYGNGLWIAGQNSYYANNLFLISKDTSSSSGCATPVYITDSTYLAQDSIINIIAQAINVTWVNVQDTLTSFPLNESFDCLTGTSETQMAAPSFTVFPNPASDYVIIEISNREPSGEIVIIDQLSREVYRHKTNNDQQIKISLANFPDGIYFCQYLEKNDIKASGKFIVSH